MVGAVEGTCDHGGWPVFSWLSRLSAHGFCPERANSTEIVMMNLTPRGSAQDKPARTSERIGVYDSRAIVVAFAEGVTKGVV